MDKIIELFSPVNLFIFSIVIVSAVAIKERTSKDKPKISYYTVYEVIDELKNKLPEQLSLEQLEGRLGLRKEDVSGSGIYTNVMGERFELIEKKRRK